MQQQVTTEVVKEVTVTQEVVNVGPNYQPFMNVAIGQKFLCLKGIEMMKIGNALRMPGQMKPSPVVVRHGLMESEPANAVCMSDGVVEGYAVKVGQVLSFDNSDCVVLPNDK